ncbi:MAG: hypothetical protein QXG55_00280 [Thermoplasmata archaeon]
MDCRMFVSVGTKEFSSWIYNALLLASKDDIFLKEFSKNTSHNNGWGMVIFSNEKEIYLRSSRPIYNDNIDLNFFNSSKIYSLFHARLASTNEPKNGPDDSHPYRIDGEETIYLAHNGHVKKEIIGKKYGINVNNKTDTEVMAFMLSKFDGKAEERIKNMINDLHKLDAVETLNLLFLVNERVNKKIYYYSEFTSREKYLTLFKYKENDNVAIMSSTIAYKLNLVDSELGLLSENVEKVETKKLGVVD